MASCMFGTWANMLDKGSSGENQDVVVGWSHEKVWRSAEQGFDAVLRLAAMIDRDLTSYLEATTRVAQLLEGRPGLKPDSP